MYVYGEEDTWNELKQTNKKNPTLKVELRDKDKERKKSFTKKLIENDHT